MYKERIKVLEVFSKVFSVGAANIAKFILATFIPSLAILFTCFCSGLIIGSAALLSGTSLSKILLCTIVCLVVIFGVCIPLNVGLYSIARKYQDTQEIKFSNIATCFREHMVLKSIGLSFLLAIIIIVGTLLLVVPGIILSLMFVFAFFVMLDNPELGILEVISLSAKMAKGYKLKILGYCILLAIIPGIFYILLHTSIVGFVIYYIISLIVSAFTFFGLSFFYMDSRERNNTLEN